MRALFNTSILVGMLFSLSCSAWAQEADPLAAANAAQDAAAEAAAMNALDSSIAPAPKAAMGEKANAINIMPPLPAHVAAEPAALPAVTPPVDQRIKQLSYDEGDVYTITTKYGYQTNIVFSNQEEIETISVGDKSVWQIIPSGNRIFIRPMEEDVITNMTVLTNRRSYQFDLKSLGPAQTEGNIYVATFIYPDEIIAAAQAAAAEQAAGLQPMYNASMYGGVPVPANDYVAAPGAPAGQALMTAPEAVQPAAPVKQGLSYTTPVYAAPVQPMPANVPFGGPTPAPSAALAAETVREPVKKARKETKAEKLARLNSEPSPPTKYYEVPVVAAPAASNAASVPLNSPFGGPTPPPASVAAIPAAPVEVVVPPVNANFNYTYTGADDLAPLQVFDNGQDTYLKYASLSEPLPEAYTLDVSGQVVALPRSVRGDYMVVEGIAPEIIVKNAGGSVHVYNESLSPKP